MFLHPGVPIPLPARLTIPLEHLEFQGTDWGRERHLSMDPIIVAFGVGIVAIAVLLQVWFFSRARQMLESWAKANGLRLLSSRFGWIRRGPFFWNSSKAQMVYRVTVKTAEGRTRTGWVRCGSYWGGVFVEKVEVRWDDEQP